MSPKLQIVIVVVLVVGAFVAGRWLAPAKVVTEIKTIEVEKKSENKERKEKKRKRKETETTTTTAPDGTSTTITRTIEDSGSDTNVNENKTSDNTRITDNKSETIRETSKVTISALAGINPLNPAAPVYGAAITKPILGPLTVGVFGMTNGLIGASVGVTF